MTDFFDAFEAYPPPAEAVAEWATGQHDPRTLLSAAEALIDHIRRGLAPDGTATSPEVTACEEALGALVTSLVVVDRPLVETLLDFDPRVARVLLTGNEALGDEEQALVCRVFADRVTARSIVDWTSSGTDEVANLELAPLGAHVEQGGELPPPVIEDLLELITPQIPVQQNSLQGISGFITRANAVWNEVLRHAPLEADRLCRRVREIVSSDVEAVLISLPLQHLLTHRNYPAQALIEQLRDGTLHGVLVADLTDALLEQSRYAENEYLLNALRHRLMLDLRDDRLEGGEGAAYHGLKLVLENVGEPDHFRPFFDSFAQAHPRYAAEGLVANLEVARRSLTTEDLGVLLARVESGDLRARLIALLDRFPSPATQQDGGVQMELLRR